MKNKLFQKILCMILSVTLLLSAVGLTSSAALKDPKPGEKFPYSPTTLDEMKSLVGTLSYEDYLKNHDPNAKDLTPLHIDIKNFSEGSNAFIVGEDNVHCLPSMIDTPENWELFGDENLNNTVYLPASGSVTWLLEVNEEQAGMYYIKIEYFNCITDESSVSSIERVFKIDGKMPFDEVGTLILNKNWRYDNVEVSKPVDTDEADDYRIEYVEDEDNNCYKKVVTSIENGKKTVTTYTIAQHINNNSMSPEAAAVPMWNTYYLQDNTGYYDGYFNFYIADGTRSFTLEAEREPVIIKSITLEPVPKAEENAGTSAEYDNNTPSYDEVKKEYDKLGYKAPTNGSTIRIEAEFPDLVSDSSVAPSNDNTSAITYPISSGSQLFNVIGETSYSSVGQWAAYKFRVTEDGLYNFAMRYKQSALEGMFICRTIKIAGGKYGDTPVVPYDEAYNAQFNYSDDWQSTFVCDANARELQFYFEAGYEYTVYLECSLGELRQHIQKVETSLNNVNAVYLAILQLTGTDPDEYRDYQFLSVMPETLITLKTEAGRLMEVKADLETLCKTTGSHLATLETVARLLNTMGEDGGANVAANMSTLKSYLGTLGTWINDSKRGSMMVDTISVVPTVMKDGKAVADEDALPKAKANFFQSLWLEVCSFFSSFFVNYDQMGLTTIPDEDTTTIDVWLALGRDQSQIWRTMIDKEGSFSDSTGVAVALKLVTGGTLLPSILSGKGPDVYLGLGSAEVINYAVRSAVVGTSGNDTRNLTKEQNEVFTTTYYSYRNADGTITTSKTYDPTKELTYVSKPYQEFVAGNFAPAAMDTITLLDVSYGVPQTMSFAMMFYRMDVLAELNQKIPESWGELLSILPILQSNNMNIGVSYINALDFMIYQEGGNMWMYTDPELYDSRWAGAKIALDSEIALKAFEFTCRLYSDYSFPVSYDAANRFRTGEMPIIIGDYAGIYNQLVVYATEIEGLWEFCSLPGSQRKDGTFNYDSLAGVGATVILDGCEDMLAAWQFVQWQTAAEAQAEYGNRMVALIGPSAKYESANLNAIENMSWTSSEKAAIKNQMEHLSSIVNYPGSYIITRYMQFAFLDAVNNGANANDALMGYIDAINTELSRKREEFGDMLWIYDPENPPKMLETED